MILLDVGVWLALVHEAHRHHNAARRWVEGDPRQLVLCRVTQMSLLRLVTNDAVMGPDVLTRAEAWRLVDGLRDSGLVAWLAEPASLEPVWRALSAQANHDHKLWTDDYLAAFGQSAGIPLLTLDRRMAERYPAVDVIALN